MLGHILRIPTTLLIYFSPEMMRIQNVYPYSGIEAADMPTGWPLEVNCAPRTADVQHRQPNKFTLYYTLHTATLGLLAFISVSHGIHSSIGTVCKTVGSIKVSGGGRPLFIFCFKKTMMYPLCTSSSRNPLIATMTTRSGH